MTVEVIKGGATGQPELPSLAMQTRAVAGRALMLKVMVKTCASDPLRPVTVTV